MEKTYFVYILTNKINTVFYTGVTSNLDKRLWEHTQKISPSAFTKKYRTNKLVWYEEFSTPYEAIAFEKKVKGWLRIKKIALIKSKNPTMDDLSLA